VPPLTEAGWLSEFDKYRRIPEYRYVNAGMSLAEFQIIYWWEWGTGSWAGSSAWRSPSRSCFPADPAHPAGAGGDDAGCSWGSGGLQGRSAGGW
jgi:hypothetical protein